MLIHVNTVKECETKMTKDLKPDKKGCFDFASQDDSSNTKNKIKNNKKMKSSKE